MVDTNGLTEAEREALTFDPTAWDDDDEQDVEAESPGAAETATAESEEKEAAPEAEAKEPEGSDGDKADSDGFRSRLTDVEATDEEKIAALETEMDELSAQFDDGGLSAKEYRKILREIQKEMDAISRTAFEREIEVKAANKAAQGIWDRDVKAWFDTPERKALVENQIWLQAFDTAVRTVQSDPANDSLSNMRVLDKAYTAMAEAFGVPAQKARTPEKPVVERPRAKPAAPVPTLANVGASAPGGVDNGEFASLSAMMDRNDGKYEAAFAKLSPAKQKEFGLYLEG